MVFLKKNTYSNFEYQEINQKNMKARIVETKHCVQLAIGGGSRTFGFLGFIMSAIVPVFLSCIIPLYYYVTTYFTNDMHSGAKH